LYRLFPFSLKVFQVSKIIPDKLARALHALCHPAITAAVARSLGIIFLPAATDFFNRCGQKTKLL